MEINGVIFGGRKKLVTCNYCNRDVSLSCRIHCAECQDFKLCGDCFCAGVKLLPHLPTHSYRVVDNLDFPVFTKDWSAQEELLLLESVEKFGAGNWKQISDYISTPHNLPGVGKTNKQCEEHYWELYMGIHGYCLPAKALNPAGELVDIEPMLTSKDANKCLLNDGYTMGEVVVRDRPVGLSSSGNSSSSQALAQAVIQPEPPLDKRKKANTDKDDLVRLKLLALPGAELPGFLPLREDFDVEPENDAEVLLAEMEFSPEDHPTEKALKLQVIQIYNKKLDERNKRKRFAIDRGLVDFKKQQQQERRRNKEERELTARMRVFARFQTPEEHEALIDGLIKARKLRTQIQIYQSYRKMGVRTMEQGRQYDIDRKKREVDVKAQKQRQQSAYGAQGALDGPAANNTTARRRNAIDDEPSSAKAPARGNKRAPEEAAITINKAPGCDLLSPKELELCTAVPMLPMHFLAVKDALVREAYRNGSLTLEGMRRVVKIETPKAHELFDFFVKQAGLDEEVDVPVGKRMREE